MKNLLYISFDINPKKEYPCVLDEPYIDNFNEQIDSMSILIDGVTEQTEFNRPYHFCKIENKGENGFQWNGKDYVIMLLDNYVETETDIFNHVYKYQLNLMNIIKLFEKIQCPNLVITHSLVSGSKTIYDYINQYMLLYSPQVKITHDGETWEKEWLFNWEWLNKHPFNDTVAADMQMNNPTLRELLTNLMLQVGCIPTIEYRTLKAIDFREEQTEFIPNGVSSIMKSGASDSYANVLISQPTQVLDTTNEVITEKIGFRDNKNALIKQTENLKLTTRFPIYNIKKVMLQYDIPKYVFWPSNIDAEPMPYIGIGNTPVIAGMQDQYQNHVGINPTIVQRTEGGRYEILLNFVGRSEKMIKGTISNLKVHICKYDEDSDSYEELSVATTLSSWRLTYDDNTSAKNASITGENARELLPGGTFGALETNTAHSEVVDPAGYNYYIYLTLPESFSLSEATHIWYEFVFFDEYNNKSLMKFVPLRSITTVTGTSQYKAVTKMGYSYIQRNTWTQLGGMDFYDDYDVPMSENTSFKGGWQVDVTSCFVEQSKRALLDTDFTTMPSAGTLQDLAKWIYGTVGYSIGGTEITGFSERYSKAVGWWNETRIYFDNILQFIKINKIGEKVAPDSEEAAEYSQKYGGMPTGLDFIHFSNEDPVVDSYKGKYLFDITYQPLNSFKFKLTKKQDTNIPLEIQQLNQSADGLSEYSRLIKNNQDTVNRIGNEILFIPQTVTNVSDLNKLNSLFRDKYTIFQRKIQLHEDYIECLYSASEKFVMQNYFTSIIQKYRAYEYVDYNQSIIRKENRTIYCLLSSEKSFTGSDIVTWHTVGEEILLSGMLPYSTGREICYNIKMSLGQFINSQDNYEPQYVKNEISSLVHTSGFAVVYQDYDNVSAGPFIMEEAPSSDFWVFNPDSLPGIAQKWQLWKQETYNSNHYVGFAYKIEIASIDLNDVLKFPILVDNKSPILFNIHNNKLNSITYDFYKDNAETINQTIQFEYYSDNGEVEFTVNFFKRCRLINQLDKNIVVNSLFILDEDAEILEKTTTTGRTEILFRDEYFNVGYDLTLGNAYIDINWSLIPGTYSGGKIVFSYKSGDTVYDFIAFKYKSQNTRYYLSLNDHKSSDVWYFKNDDDLFETYECTTLKNCNLKNN